MMKNEGTRRQREQPKISTGNNETSRKMEMFMEKKEREERKNNIIIKGLRWKETSEKLRRKIEKFILEKVRVKVEVKYTRQMNFRNMIMAKIGTFEQKISIMENKKNLGTEEIYIENDNTKKKREIQRKVAEIAKREREKNKEADIKISRWKICIDGTWYKWNEAREKMEKQVFQRN